MLSSKRRRDEHGAIATDISRYEYDLCSALVGSVFHITLVSPSSQLLLLLHGTDVT